MSPYWRRARSYAWSNAKLFTPVKAIPSALAAIIHTVWDWWFGSLDQDKLLEAVIFIGIGVGTYALCYIVDFLWKLLIKAPVAIDAQHQVTIKDLAKPPRTPAEEQHYQEAKSALEEFGHEVIPVLKHLWTHDQMTFTIASSSFGAPQFMYPQLPDGIDGGKARTWLSRCANKNLVTVRTVPRQTGGVAPALEETYQIATGMRNVLEELSLWPPCDPMNSALPCRFGRGKDGHDMLARMNCCKLIVLVTALAAPAWTQTPGPKAPATTDAFRTGDLVNGRFWITLDKSQRNSFAIGYSTATTIISALQNQQFTDFLRVTKQFWPGGLIASGFTPDMAREALDRFYEPPENRAITIPSALNVISKRVEGMDETEIQNLITALRKSSSQ